MPEGEVVPAAPAAAPRGAVRVALGTALKVFLVLLGLALAVFAALSAAGYYLARGGTGPAAPAVENAKALAAENQQLLKKLEKNRPKGQFLVVDTGKNRLTVRDGERVVREVVVSCGSGGILEDPRGGRTWVFDTPRGERQVRSKAKNPTWIKPDWAFIEEGEPIPASAAERAEANMMGDYALGIGKGYFIHGTLYKRLLGRNVSHGCVRLGDEDLEFLFKTATLGTKVIIY
jgi:L,D-transpeptidase YbiS